MLDFIRVLKKRKMQHQVWPKKSSSKLQDALAVMQDQPRVGYAGIELIGAEALELLGRESWAVQHTNRKIVEN